MLVLWYGYGYVCGYVGKETRTSMKTSMRVAMGGLVCGKANALPLLDGMGWDRGGLLCVCVCCVATFVIIPRLLRLSELRLFVSVLWLRVYEI